MRQQSAEPDGNKRFKVNATTLRGGRAAFLERLKRVARKVPGSRRVLRRARDGVPLSVTPTRVVPVRSISGPKPDPRVPLERYRRTRTSQQPDSFVLYRIIGNDLPPKHVQGEARHNLFYILNHEPELPQCIKRFVVNRIVDHDEEAKIISLLETYKQPYIRIPFDPQAYASLRFDYSAIPTEYLPGSKNYQWLPADQRQRIYGMVCRHKINYVMNNNGARNAALEEGRFLAKWVLPWDGGCFLTTEGFQQLKAAIEYQPYVPYFIVPMVRLNKNEDIPNLRPHDRPEEEPQLTFRCDAAMRFDPAYPYGRRPKVELLWRLGVPGPWDDWGLEPWDLPYPGRSADAGAFEWAGWVARLAGRSVKGDECTWDGGDRALARADATANFIEWLDQYYGDGLNIGDSTSPTPENRD